MLGRLWASQACLGSGTRRFSIYDFRLQALGLLCLGFRVPDLVETSYLRSKRYPLLSYFRGIRLSSY